MTNATLVFGLSALAMAVATAQTGGTASGSLTVNGKAIKLGSAQAMKAEHYVFGANNEPVLATVIMVFVSDMPADDLEDNFELSERAKAGKLHGLLLTFTKDGKPYEGTIYHEALQTGAESIFLSSVVFDRGVHKDTSAFGGTMQTKEAIDLIDMKDKKDESRGKLDFKVTFNSPYMQEPRPTAEGDAAAGTAPAKAVQEFIRAVEASDLPALKRIVRKEVADILEDQRGQQMLLGMLAESFPPGKKIRITRVFDFGDRASVEGASQRKEKNGKLTDETYKLRAIKVNGEWKVSPL